MRLSRTEDQEIFGEKRKRKHHGGGQGVLSEEREYNGRRGQRNGKDKNPDLWIRSHTKKSEGTHEWVQNLRGENDKEITEPAGGVAAEFLHLPSL